MPTTELTSIDETIIKQVRDRILEACDPEAIVLFGKGNSDLRSAQALLALDPPRKQGQPHSTVSRLSRSTSKGCSLIMVMIRLVSMI
jgi:hypothetical protein